MKDLMLQALNEMDKIFYNSIDEKLTPTQKAKAEEQWDFCYEKLETMINASYIKCVSANTYGSMVHHIDDIELSKEY